MSNTIVMNLRNGAVSEYDAGLSYGRSLATSPTGLYRFNSGDLDDLDAISAAFSLPSTTLGQGTHLIPRYAYIDVRGRGLYRLTVTPRGASAFTYPFSYHPGGRQRAIFGRGLRANYFGFEFHNVEGAAFSVDKFDLVVDKAEQRRV